MEILFLTTPILDYQDFELPLDDSIELIIKICGYAGISIREPEVVQFEQIQQGQQNQVTQ